MNRVILVVFVALILGASAQAASITFTLLPAGGDVAGAPGTAVGWGFTLTNPTSAWVVLTGSEFTGSQVQGTYVDYLSIPSAPFYVAGPAPESSTVQQSWDISSALGLGEFDINTTAQPGTDINGDITLDYSVFSVDPNTPLFDPDTDTLIPNATLSNAVQIAVITPEPTSLTFLMAILVLPLTYPGWRRYVVRRA